MRLLNKIEEHLYFAFFSKAISFGIALLCSAVIVSPLLGTLLAACNLRWGIPSAVMTLILAALLALPMRRIFHIQNLRTAGAFLSLLLLFTFFFKDYSPVLEIRQDPSVYMFRALNLINYGSANRPAPILKEAVDTGGFSENNLAGYSKIQNGIKYTDGSYIPDFYPGGSFFYALLGVFYKPLVVLGPPLTALAAICASYFFMRRMLGENSDWIAALLTGSFMVSPVFVWFGRAPYSEPGALLVFCLALLMFDQLQTKLSIPVVISIVLVMLAGSAFRIEYLLLIYLALVLLTHWKAWAGLMLLLASAVFIPCLATTCPIYHSRIYSSLKNVLFTYDIELLCVTYIFCLAFFKFIKIDMDRIIRSRLVFWALMAVFFTAVLLIFRNNIIAAEDFEKKIIHGRFIRTFNEENLDRLSTVFPSLIIVGGLLGVPFLARNQNFSPYARAFLLCAALPFTLYLYKSSNSPQMYWNLRRYLYVVIPTAFFGFGTLLTGVKHNAKHILGAACLILSLNNFFDSKQTPEFKGMDTSVKAFERLVSDKEGLVVLYDPSLRYQISSLVSYTPCEFMPVDDQNALIDIVSSMPNNSSPLLFIQDSMPDLNPIEVNIRYQRMGESCNSLPRQTYQKQYRFFGYEARRYLQILQRSKEEKPTP